MIKLTHTREQVPTGGEVQVVKLIIPDADYMEMNQDQLDALQHSLEDLRDLVGWMNG